MSLIGGPNTTKDSLILHLDAANPKSYPGTGTTWYDLSGNGNNATLFNSPIYNVNNGLGSFEFDDYKYLNFPEISLINQAFTLEFCGSIVNFDSRRTIFIGDFPGELSNNSIFFTALKKDDVTFYSNFGSGGWPYKVPTGEPFMWTFLFYPNRDVTWGINSNLNPLDFEDFSGAEDITFKFNGFGRNSGRPYYGDLYGLRIYNKALNLEEIKNNYNSFIKRFNNL